MPTELELIALQTEFDLYLTFTKRLVLNLPDSDDRTRAAIWLQKLRTVEDENQKKLRNEHLKLLLFALHRRALVGVFAKPPPDELESFHDGLTLLEMTRELIEITEKQLASGDSEVKECPLPAVATNLSADLKEYCATQAIPKFGAHVYYAISNEPIQMWSKSPNSTYPSPGDIPNPLQWELTLSKLTDHVLEKQAEADRLLAEAKEAEDNPDKEEDTVQVLPKLEVTPCPGSPVFKWKADSKLTLHQNYDFSDVGVAEDLEGQGKHQLELDEMAFQVMDQSLPGRQRIVVRDPYFTGLPPDLAERRHHGVIDEISEDDEESTDEEEPCPPPPPPPPPLPPPCPPPCDDPCGCEEEEDPCQDYQQWDNNDYDECNCPAEDDQCQDFGYDDQNDGDWGCDDFQGGNMGGGQFDQWSDQNQGRYQQPFPQQQQQQGYGRSRMNQMDQAEFNQCFGGNNNNGRM